MCLAVPAKIISINNDMATIDVYGARKDVSVMLLTEAPVIGDYVLVHAGFAIQSIKAEVFRTRIRRNIRLAEALGVQTPSLYNHVDGLPGLRRELALLSARSLGQCLADAAIGRSGPEALAALAQAYRSFIRENPGLYASRPPRNARCRWGWPCWPGSS